MTSTDFEPPEVPLNSRALVRTLKRRLLEAIETGKAADAKTYVDIIERLAKMAWLDDATPQERNAADQARNTKIMADVDIRLARFLKSKREEDEQAKKDL